MPNHASLPENIRASAQILWDYMRIDQALEKCDVAVAMGGHDLRTAAYAAQLVMDGWANILVCSGGTGRLTSGVWAEPEAVLFAREAERSGLAGDKILLESNSTNTSENLVFTKKMLDQQGICFDSALLIHKPYMERRVLATAGKDWPHIKTVISSPPISFQAYPTQAISINEVIHIMVGDFQRIMEYPKKGYAVEQEIPDYVIKAFNLLKSEGFDTQLI